MKEVPEFSASSWSIQCGSNCLMIGDFLTDIEAARAAGSPGIAYANKPAKWERFAPQQPDAILGHMTELLTVDMAT
jgi:phosphoglycolate phosphatase-like HAD superfamily hydrolase